MNKKLLFSVLGASALVGFTACQNDDLMSNGADGGVQTVTFSAQLPSAMTRAYGDAESIKKLQYAIYASGTDNKVKEGTEDVVDKSATVSVDLVKGQSYDVYFWADKGTGSPYTFNGKTVSIYYGSIGNDDTRDAFYASKTIKASSTEEAITLTRPFAQLNIATTDYASANAQGFEIQKVSVTTKAYQTINLSSNGCTGEDETTVTVSSTTLPSGDFPINGSSKSYKYLAMNYLFTGNDYTETVSFTITPKSGDPITCKYDDVPMKENFRTNIAGSFLTNPLEFSISISENFAGEEWDHKTVEMPVAVEGDNKSFIINNAAQLAGFANLVNTGSLDGNTTRTNSGVNYAQMNFTLNASVDLGGHEWTPLANYQGVFNGNGNTISNFKMTEGGDNVGFFGKVSGEGHIENVKFKDVTIRNAHNAAGAAIGQLNIPQESKHYISKIIVENVDIEGEHWIGGVVGYAYGNIENCEAHNIKLTAKNTVKDDGTYDNGDKVGGIVGHAAEYQYNITGKVTNATIRGYRDLGGLVGSANYAKITGEVSDIEIIVDDTKKYYEKGVLVEAGNAGEILGRKVYSPVITEESTAKNVIIRFVDEKSMDINTLSQLKIFGSSVNAGYSYSGKTITLGADMDLGSIEDWMPIGQYSGTAFMGTFDGNDKTISNMKIIENRSYTDGKNDYYGRGFFGSVSSATIQNVTFDNAHITPTIYKGNCQGIVTGYAYGKTTFKNVKVSKSSNKGFGKLGVFVGYVGSETAEITFDSKCKIESSQIDGVYNMAALIGLITHNRLGDAKTTVNMPENFDVTGVTINNDEIGRNFIYMFGNNKYWAKDEVNHYLVSSTYYCTNKVVFTVLLDGSKIAIDAYADDVTLTYTDEEYIYVNGTTYKLVKYEK
jgi:hypothetical protein